MQNIISNLLGITTMKPIDGIFALAIVTVILALFLHYGYKMFTFIYNDKFSKKNNNDSNTIEEKSITTLIESIVQKKISEVENQNNKSLYDRMETFYKTLMELRETIAEKKMNKQECKDFRDSYGEKVSDIEERLTKHEEKSETKIDDLYRQVNRIKGNNP